MLSSRTVRATTLAPSATSTFSINSMSKRLHNSSTSERHAIYFQLNDPFFGRFSREQANKSETLNRKKQGSFKLYTLDKNNHLQLRAACASNLLFLSQLFLGATAALRGKKSEFDFFLFSNFLLNWNFVLRRTA